jgi:NhaP-type Na+/H+ or K+/H+ antiporter
VGFRLVSAYPRNVTSIASSAGFFTILLACALAISIAAERLRLPPAVLLVGGGALAAALWHVALPFPFGPALLFVFLPPLIFEASWHLNLREARRNVGAIGLLAIFATLAGAFAVAFVADFTGAMPFAAALILGSILAATDPIAVTAIFRSVGVPENIRAIVEAESIGNDGVSLVLYGIALTMASGAAVSWYHAIAHGSIAVVMGCVAGAVCAVPLWLAFSISDASEYEVAGTVALAYSSYLLATALGWSGIFACASAAVTLRLLIRRRAHMQHLRRVGEFWHSTAYMTNSIVFLATGLSIVAGRIVHEPWMVVVVLLTLFAVRAVLSFAAMPRWPQSAFVFFAGVRGALPLALALALPVTTPYRAQIVDGVFAVVIVTLAIQGGLVKRALQAVAGSSAVSP